MLTNLAAASALDHPLLVARENPKRAAVLVVSSDRGLCGAYNANLLRRSEELFALLREEGKSPVLYVVGRKALSYYTFRNWSVVESWVGYTDKPTYENAQEIADTLVEAFLAGADDDGDGAGEDGILGVGEVHIVVTEVRCCPRMLRRAGSHRWSSRTWSPIPGRTRCSRSSPTPPLCSSRCFRVT